MLTILLLESELNGSTVLRSWACKTIALCSSATQNRQRVADASFTFHLNDPHRRRSYLLYMQSNRIDIFHMLTQRIFYVAHDERDVVISDRRDWELRQRSSTILIDYRLCERCLFRWAKECPTIRMKCLARVIRSIRRCTSCKLRELALCE